MGKHPCRRKHTYAGSVVRRSKAAKYSTLFGCFTEKLVLMVVNSMAVSPTMFFFKSPWVLFSSSIKWDSITHFAGTSLMFQWLTLCALSAKDLGSIPAQRTRENTLYNYEFAGHKLKIPHASAETQHHQMNEYIILNK